LPDVKALARRIGALDGVRRAAVTVLAGAALALTQAPVSWPFVLFLALPILLWQLDGTGGAGEAFGVGWLAGAGYFTAGIFWIVEPFLVDPVRHGWMAPFALAGMGGGLALFWAIPFALARRLWPAHGARIVVLAGLWTLSEFARAHVLTGFPWALLGYAWVETPVIQAAALGGPHLLGFLTLVAGLLPGLLSLRAAAAAAALVAAGWGLGALRVAQPLPERPEAPLVRIVQPNAAQHLKWRPDMQREFHRRLLDATRAPGAPDVVIWPETAVDFVLGRAPDLQAEVAAAPGPEGWLILGIRRAEPTGEGWRWFNSLAVLRPDGSAAAVYDKHHLVPFGEYIPFAAAVARLGLPGLDALAGAGFSDGPGPRVVAASGVPAFLPLICYEAIFPHGLRAPGGRPEWLVQVTNDAWFGEVAGPYQHLAQARLRAIEQGLPLARAANTGVSAMIDPRGRIVGEIGLGAEGYVDAALPAALPPTPYARFGDWPALAVVLASLGLTVVIFNAGIFNKSLR
jgi:apolipoprotein N-acyltransferase